MFYISLCSLVANSPHCEHPPHLWCDACSPCQSGGLSRTRFISSSTSSQPGPRSRSYRAPPRKQCTTAPPEAVALDPHIDGRDAHTDLVRLGTSSKFAVATEITLEGWAPESEEEGIQHAVMGPKEVAGTVGSKNPYRS